MASETQGRLTREEARALIGCSDRAMSRYIREGSLKPKVIEGKHSFSREECIELTKADAEARIATAEREQMVASLKSANDHVETLLKLIVQPLQELNSYNVSLLKTQSKRIESLEKRWMKTLELTEELMGEAHERDLKRMKAEKMQERMSEGFDFFKQNAPRFMEGVFAANDVKDLVRSLSGEQLEVLTSTEGFLSDAQRAALVDIVAKIRAADDKGKADQHERRDDGKTKAEPGGAADQGGSVASGGAGTAGRSAGRRKKASGGGAKKRRRTTANGRSARNDGGGGT